MDLNEFFDYKNKLMQDICSNQRIVQLVTDNESSEVPNKKLPYTQVFPFEYVPDTVDDAKTFICFDVDIDNVINNTFYIPVLYIWVFTHKSKLRLQEGGVRIDEMTSELSKILNGSRYYGLGELKLHSVGRFSPISNYLGRVSVYYAKDFNNTQSKYPPSNRRKRCNV